jgi:hypothetical protein
MLISSSNIVFPQQPIDNKHHIGQYRRKTMANENSPMHKSSTINAMKKLLTWKFILPIL